MRTASSEKRDQGFSNYGSFNTAVSMSKTKGHTICLFRVIATANILVDTKCVAVDEQKVSPAKVQSLEFIYIIDQLLALFIIFFKFISYIIFHI